MGKRTFRALALRTWSKNTWVTGEGHLALLSHCTSGRYFYYGPTITLHKTMESALASKKWIDELACGGGCTKKHEIFDMGINSLIEKKLIAEIKRIV